MRNLCIAMLLIYLITLTQLISKYYPIAYWSANETQSGIQISKEIIKAVKLYCKI